MIDLDFIAKLNKFLTDHPASVTRLVTTEQRNQNLGGAKDSAHLFKNGNAVDLIFDSDAALYAAATAAKAYGFSGIELDLTNYHLHLDTKPRHWMVVHYAKNDERPLEDWVKSHSEV
jgi:hypothetical protein